MAPIPGQPRTAPPLLLASSSPYRRELLMRLGLPFAWAAPDIDESAGAGEDADTLVRRLAEAKARALADRFPAHLIIGGDQVAVCAGHILGKPGTAARAVAQLERANGRSVVFHTSICLLDGRTGHAEVEVVPTRVVFRRLRPDQIAAYVEREQPLDCAGSFKVERLGIALFERVECPDPTALTGLPLIALTGLLARAGVDVLSADVDPAG